MLIVVAIVAAIFATQITQSGRRSSFDHFDSTISRDFGERDPFAEPEDLTGTLLRRFIGYSAWLLVAAVVIAAIVVLVSS